MGGGTPQGMYPGSGPPGPIWDNWVNPHQSQDRIHTQDRLLMRYLGHLRDFWVFNNQHELAAETALVNNVVPDTDDAHRLGAVLSFKEYATTSQQVSHSVYTAGRKALLPVKL